MKAAQKENIATLLCTTLLVLGLYALGAGAHAGWGFLLLLNLNIAIRNRDSGDPS